MRERAGDRVADTAMTGRRGNAALIIHTYRRFYFFKKKRKTEVP